jgi:hypothetical protein
MYVDVSSLYPYIAQRPDHVMAIGGMRSVHTCTLPMLVTKEDAEDGWAGSLVF